MNNPLSSRIGALAGALLAVFLLGCAQMSPPSAGAGSVLQRIQDRGALVVGMAGDMPPLNYRSRDGDMMGFEVDLARAFAGRMNVDLAVDLPLHPAAGVCVNHHP